ncbi:MAG: dihydrolipoyl dehydrogenase [Acidobacteriota bacterium]
MESFDVVVIGAGPGGYVSAIRAAQLGLKTALVEKDASLGGTCLNVGCIPSKALLESSERYHEALHGLAVHGVEPSSVRLDLAAMMARKASIVKDLTDGIGLLMKKNRVAVLRGEGLLKGPGKVEVRAGGGSQEIQAKAVVLAMGSVPVELPFLPFDGERVVTSTEALSFQSVPGNLCVVGAGAVGLELGSVWRRLGAQVTVVEMLPRIAPFADGQMSTLLERSLKAQGLVLKTSTALKAAEVLPDGVALTLENAKGEREILAAEKVLVAVGRRPASFSAGLGEAGVALDDKGRVAVNERFETNLPGVYAIGDLIRGPMLAHKASEEGIAVAEILAGKPGHVNYGAIPNVVYTSPELACVGKTEEELKAEGVPYKAGKFFFKGNGRAKSLAMDEGAVKVLAHAETDTLLGVHIVGPRASDLIPEAVLALEFKASAEDIARTSHAHPTLSEALMEACLAVDKRAIHG